MRDYQNIVVLDYTIKNDGDTVELGIPNPNHNPRKYNSELLMREFVDPRKILEDVENLEARLGTDNPVVKAGKQVIEQIEFVRQKRYDHKKST